MILNEWQEKALDLRGTMGSRAIGVIVGRSKSSVNDFYKAYDQFNEELDVVEEADTTEDYDKDLDSLSEHPDFSVSNLAKRLRAAQKSNNQLRKVQRELFDSEVDTEPFFKRMQNVVDGINKEPYSAYVCKAFNAPYAVVGTLEILFSDMQIGKLCADYNTDAAKQRMVRFSNDIQDIINTTPYKIERIIVASLGDIVEDHLK